MAESRDGFLSRWSQRKLRTGAAPELVRAEPPRPVPTSPVPVAPAQAAEAAVPSAEPAAVQAPALTLDDVAQLTRESDYAAYVGTGVDPAVSRAAMKKLFTDPHFNVMDGLDTYIDDYGKPDPIPLSMLRRMNQSSVLGLFDHEDAEAEAAAPPDRLPEPQPDDPAELAAAPPEPTEPPPHDHADLQLQQDDDAGRAGAGAGARA